MPAYYRLSVKMIGRSEGKAIVASAAYRAGEILRDNRYGKTYDYSVRRGIADKGILAPERAPDWAHDREELWNRVEAREKRKDAQLAREVELALPHQVSAEQRKEMVEMFIREQLIPRGMIVDYAIHAPNRAGDQRNWHAHLLTTLRPIEGTSLANKDRDACRPEMIAQWREAWAKIQNRAFERYRIRDSEGNILRVDHRSYEDQGIEREPTQHMGVHATAMERNGQRTDIGERNRQIALANERHLFLRRTSSDMAHEDREDSRHEVDDRPAKYRPERGRRSRDSDRDDWQP